MSSSSKTVDAKFRMPDEMWCRIEGLLPTFKRQGCRILSYIQGKDLREVIDVPARHSSAHGDTFFVLATLEQTDGEAFQPGQIVGSVSIPDSAFVFTKRHIQTPVQRILNGPVAAYILGKLAHGNVQRAEVVTHVEAFFTVSNAHAYRYSN